jgi:transposase
MRTKGTAAQLQANRRRAIELLGKGWKPMAVAEALGVDSSAVYRWRKNYQEAGAQGIAAVPQHVPSCRLNSEQQKELGEIIQGGALAAGFSTDLWTTARVAQAVQQHFGISYNAAHLSRLLHKLGFSCQRPVRRARERDAQAATTWKRHKLPGIKRGR